MNVEKEIKSLRKRLRHIEFLLEPKEELPTNVVPIKPLSPGAGKMVNASTRLIEAELAAVDRQAEDHGISRNNVIRHAVRYWLEGMINKDERARIKTEVAVKHKVKF